MFEENINHIVHICQQDDWRKARRKGFYSAHSLQTEGFIHCSRPEQVLQTANRFYGSQRDLLLLWIDPELVEAEIRWETSDGEVFPHVYGRLNLEAVVAARDFQPDADGIFRKL